MLLASMLLAGALPLGAASTAASGWGSKKTVSERVVEQIGTPDPDLHGDGLVWFIATFQPGRVPSSQDVTAWGLVEGHRYASIPALGLIGTPAVVEAFLNHPDLRVVQYDQAIELFLDTATLATNAADVWASAWRPGHSNPVRPQIRIDTDSDGVPDTVVDGAGVTVSVVDTGINALHPDLWYAPAAVEGTPLEPKVLACVNFANVFNAGSVDGVDSPDCDQTVGHGTHVAGIVAGTGEASRQGLDPLNPGAPYVGVAPGASLVGAGFGAPSVGVVSVGGSIFFTTQALDWSWEHRNQYGIQVVTNSWGDAPGCTATMPVNDAVWQVTNRLVDAGITVLFAAGNYGSAATFTSTYSRNPTPGVISVANYDDQNTGQPNRRINSGSSDGCVPTGGGAHHLYTWPDVAAPGTAIMSAAAYTGIFTPVGQSPVFVGASPNGAPMYTSLSGTSMATPHVAGVVALMKQANPALTPAQVEAILVETARPWADTITARGIAGTTMWNADPDECFVSPADAQMAQGGASPPDLPGFATLATIADADLFVCRDFKRGAGLVDAYAAVQKAVSLRDDDVGNPRVTITTPADGATLEPATITVGGLVNRDAPAALAAHAGGPYEGEPGFPVAISGTATGGMSGQGFACQWVGPASADFGDATSCATAVTLPEEGVFLLQLTVDDGYESASAAANVTIAVPPPGDILYFTHEYTREGPNFADCGQQYVYKTSPTAPGAGKAYTGRTFGALACPTAFAGTTAQAVNMADGVVFDLYWACDASAPMLPSASVPEVGSTSRLLVELVSADGTTSYGSARYTEPDPATVVCDGGVRHTPVTVTGTATIPQGTPIWAEVNFFVVSADRESPAGGNLHVLTGGTTPSALYLSGGPSSMPGGAASTAAAGAAGGSTQDLYFHGDQFAATPADPQASATFLDANAPTGAESKTFVKAPGQSGVFPGTIYGPSWTYNAGGLDVRNVDVTITWYANIVGPTAAAGSVLPTNWDLQVWVDDGDGAWTRTDEVADNANPDLAVSVRTEIPVVLGQVNEVSYTFNNVSAKVDPDGRFAVTVGQVFAVDDGAGVFYYDSAAHPAGVTIKYPETGEPLTALPGGPYAGSEGLPVDLAGSFSGGDGQATCSWSTSDDGVFEESSSCQTNVTFASSGAKTVTLTVTDSTGSDAADAVVDVSGEGERVDVSVDGVVVASQPVSTSSQSPTAEFSRPVDLGAAEGQVRIEATWYDADGSVLGRDAINVTVEPAPPTGELRFTSHEDEDAVPAGTTTFAGIVDRDPQPDALVAEAGGPYSGTTGSPIPVSGSAAGGSGPFACAWTGGDFADAGSCVTSVSFSTPGDRTITLTVDDGSTTAQDTATVSVAQAVEPLSVSAGGPYSGTAGQAIPVTASVAGGEAPYSCLWSVLSGPQGGQGSFDGASCSTGFTADTAGTWIINVTARDLRSRTAYDSTEVTVADPPPGASIAITNPSEGSTVASPVDLSGTVSGLEEPAQASRGWFGYGDFDPVARQQSGIVWEPWMDDIRPRLEALPGFQTGVPYVRDGQSTLALLFSGPAPEGLDAWVPSGWHVEPVSNARPVPLRQQLPPGTVIEPSDASANGVAWNDYIGPGSQLAITFAGDERDLFPFGAPWLCTANFVYKDQDGKLYLGAAGHCFLDGADKTATHGDDANAVVDPAKHRVYVCRSLCALGGFAGNIEQGALATDWVELGPIVYARQEADGPSTAEVGYDFGIVAIPPELYEYVSPEMPVWGGPTAANNPVPGDVFFIHGNGALVAETFATKSRTGVYIPVTAFGLSENTPRSWSAVTLSNGGDSGSSVGRLGPGVPVAQGVEAAGLLTHGYGDPVVGAAPTIPISLGTKITQAVAMARQAGLCLQPVLSGEDPTAVTPVADCDLVTVDEWSVQVSVDGGERVLAPNFDEVAGTWALPGVALPPGQHTATAWLRLGEDDVASHTVGFTVESGPVTTCGSGQLVATDPEGDLSVGSAGAQDVTCLGASVADDRFRFHLEVVDAASRTGVVGTIWYDLYFSPDFGANAGADYLVSVEYYSDGTVAAYWDVANHDPTGLVPLFFGHPYLPSPVNADVAAAWAGNELVVSFPLSYLGTPGPAEGDRLVGVYVDVNDCGSGATCALRHPDYAPDSRDATVTFGAGGGVGPQATAIMDLLRRQQAFGPRPELSGERVELYVAGSFAGWQAVQTSAEDPLASWSVDGDVAEGSNVVTAEWYDSDGVLLAAASLTVSGTHVNQAPIASISGPDSLLVGQTGTWDGSSSSDPDGVIVGYDWDFGDGATVQGVSAEHAYAAAGTYVVTLTVTDDAGATGQASATVTVSEPPNEPPSASIAGPATATVGQSASFDGSASTDADGVVVSYAWDFGDGATAEGVQVSHAWSAPGVYTVRLVVTDDDGAQASALHDVEVFGAGQDHKPKAKIDGPRRADVGQGVTFDGSGSTDREGAIASYSWDLGDGTTATGGAVTHSYAAAGSYWVVLTVADSAGQTGQAKVRIQVG